MTGKINIGVVEDNQEDLHNLMKGISKLEQELGLFMDILFCAKNYNEFVDKLSCNSIDLCFVDIDLYGEDKNGIDVAEYIDNTNKDIKIVFLTGHNNYTMNAVKVSAFDYILKPLNQMDLKRTMNRFVNKMGVGTDYLELNGNEFIRIPKNKIVYLVYDNRRVKVVTTYSVEILPSTYNLKSVKEKLPVDKFIECNSNACVNIDFIRKIDKYFVELSIDCSGLDSEGSLISNRILTSVRGNKKLKSTLKHAN